ncbi:MAG: toxin-antitoxin system protein [Chloroflexota bacterium]
MSTETHEKLRSLADEDSLSIQEVLDRAVEWYRRHVFLEKANEEYARLRADPQAWEEELAERRLLEGTLMDGLEDEPPYPLTEEEQQAVDEWRARQRRA